MKYADFLKELQGRLGKDAASAAQVKRMAEAFIALAGDVLLDEGQLSLPKLGIFRLSKMAARMVKSPKFTGVVPPKMVVRFKVSQQLKREAADIPV